MEKQTLKEWVESTLDKYDDNDIYLVEIDWKPKTKKLVVYAESDSSLSLDRCQKISRFIEKELDDSEIIGFEYSLTVSSPGIDRPLLSPRQYTKNIGRVLRIMGHDDMHIVGKLIAVSATDLTIQREMKKGKHRKATYGDEEIILFENIKETFVEIRF